MSDLHDLQARAGDLERANSGTDDRHGSLLSGLENGLNQLRERLVAARADNDRLARENTELRATTLQLLGALENQPAEQSLHDKLTALDGQIHGLLEISSDPGSANGIPVNGTPVNGTPVAAGEDDGAAKSESDTGGPFEEIRERMRALSNQLLASAGSAAAASTQVGVSEIRAAAVRATAIGAAAIGATATGATAIGATATGATATGETGAKPQEPAPIQLPASAGAPPKPAPKPSARRNLDSPRAFDRPIKALAQKAQNVLPKARLRFDAEINYALTILRRIRGGRQSFSIEEVRDLINGKFGLRLTARDDVQLSASLANQGNLIRTRRGSRGGGISAQSWRFEMG